MHIAAGSALMLLHVLLLACMFQGKPKLTLYDLPFKLKKSFRDSLYVKGLHVFGNFSVINVEKQLYSSKLYYIWRFLLFLPKRSNLCPFVSSFFYCPGRNIIILEEVCHYQNT